jgi:uncharacterized repeat protein (TIGR01451 family)
MRNLNPTAFMRKSLLTIGLGLAVSSATVLTSVAALPGVTALPGHVPAMVAQLQPNGQLPAATEMKLAIGLPLRNQAALTNLLQQLYDPASPNYRHYLTPEEFTAQFGPTEQDYQKVISFAQASGLRVTQTHGNRMLVDVSGNAADIEKAFHVSLRTFPHPAETRNFFAPDVEPTVAADLPVLHVSGLNNYIVPRPLLHKVPPSQAGPALGSGPSGSYLGNDFRNAYAPGVTLTGAGQMVGLLQFDSGFYQSDITTYELLAGLPDVPVQAVLLNGYNGGPGSANDEVSLDIEMAIAMAPGLSKIYVFEGSTTDDILNAMAASNQVKQLSASWSYPIDSVTEQIFQQFAAQGQSFFNASGDYDSWAGFSSVYPPCDDPRITIVGGTTLSTANSAWASETVWNWGIDRGSAYDGIGSGGGISTVYTIPSWQTNMNMTANKGSTTRRNLPDVALTADNVYVIYGGGQAGAFGGTSASTPLWAGFMAMVNQQAVANGQPTIGFLNPAIYALAKGPNYNNLFHDITTGNNRWSASPDRFDAVSGYDLCTGWGTPNGNNLITALAGAVVLPPSPPAPPYGSTLSVLNGGNPNGAWALFVQDDTPADVGTNYGGWILNLTLASPVGAAADNELLMTAVATNVPFGSNIVYILSVTNYGPSHSTNVLVSDTLPPGVTLVSSNFTAGSLNGTRWSVGSLAINQGATLKLTVLPGSSGRFTNSATVNASTPDPNPDDVSKSLTVTVANGAGPRLTNTVAHANGTFQFTVNGQSGQEYIVQASTNLLNWVPVYTNPSPFVSPFTFIDSNTAPYPDRFYRVITGP